jgi:uncharacterized membrane protein
MTTDLGDPAVACWSDAIAGIRALDGRRGVVRPVVIPLAAALAAAVAGYLGGHLHRLGGAHR